MRTIAIVGAGPAGVFAGIYAKDKNNKVIILERNNKIGRKLAITGKGRCNITNSSDIGDFFNEYNRNSNFCYSALYSYPNTRLVSFFEDRGLKLKEERGGRIFPITDKAFDVVDTLRNEAIRKGVEFRVNTFVTSIVKERNKFNIKTNQGLIQADKVVIATGGKSYPLTGSDGSGYKLAEDFGHKINPLGPSLVPIELEDNFVRDLAGITLKNVELKLYEENKEERREFGDLVFTHTGISGPIVLKMSTQMDRNTKYKLFIDLKPGLNYQELDRRILRDFKKYSNKAFKNSLGDLTISALIPIIVEKSGIEAMTKVNQIGSDERHRLVEVFKKFPLTYSSLKDLKYAIVTRGGIETDEINPSSMESKLIEGLYFAGEIIDVDGNTGGYNLQFAFSTGYLAGINSGGKVDNYD